LKAINAKFDWNLTFDDLIAYGRNILRIEHEFNKKAGVSAINRLPDFFYKEILPPHNHKWDLSEEQLKDFQAFF
jgi:aldehyde:ferredoxin oxidoreductase